ATYAILNEKQVGMGESTCSAVFGAKPRGHGGRALFSIDSLTRIALERAESAREAVKLMGYLAEKEGFYGANAFEGTGESLMVIDPREGFIFHILPDPSGESAIWAAQRVPDGHVGVVANMFTIRQIDPNKTGEAAEPDFLFSASVHSVAQARGWWHPSEGLLDFTKVGTSLFSNIPPPMAILPLLIPYRIPDPSTHLLIRCVASSAPLPIRFPTTDVTAYHIHRLPDLYSPLYTHQVYSDGEYAHKYYSGRRMWGAYRLLAPDTPLPSEYSDLRTDHVYPTTLPTRRKLTPIDLMAVHRSFYEGTKYDLSRGAAAGPFGNPDRYSTSTRRKGAWERSIALYRTASSHIVQVRAWLPHGVGGIMWFGPAAPHGTLYVPFAAGLQTLPPQYSVADPGLISRDSAYWAHKYSLNIARLRYDAMSCEISSLQHKFENHALAQVFNISASTPLSRLEEETKAFAARVLREWWRLPDMLIQKYADGWFEDGRALGYPDTWLDQVGYMNGPPQPPTEPELPHCCNPSWTTSERLKESTLAVVTQLSPECPRGLRACIASCGKLINEEDFSECVTLCMETCERDELRLSQS
ncbi:MAG: hypothetical protein SGPRY_000962, partial [Prymnesium sp.]